MLTNFIIKLWTRRSSLRKNLRSIGRKNSVSRELVIDKLYKRRKSIIGCSQSSAKEIILMGIFTETKFRLFFIVFVFYCIVKF